MWLLGFDPSTFNLSNTSNNRLTQLSATTVAYAFPLFQSSFPPIHTKFYIVNVKHNNKKKRLTLIMKKKKKHYAAAA